MRYLVNASSEMKVVNHDGKEIEKIPVPKYVTINNVSSNRESEEYFYSVQSFTFPNVTYRFDPASKNSSVYREVENPINPNDFEVKQEWFVSKDGARVPVFIVHKNDIKIDNDNPTILLGYGGFSHTETPVFMRNWSSWLKRGGILALANIRGGAEFGESWHKGGMKENKQNSFNDFISAAEHLIKSGYTKKEKLGIMGGSNGGLLVSACAVQRPDLFGAVCSSVPLIDMVRFHKFGIAMRWTKEYGDPEIKEEFENIMKWSPYHNVKVGVEYPACLFLTGEKDTRVNPMHARKMTAVLQAVNNENPIYLFTEIDAGHGAGKPISKVVENSAIRITFMAERLSLDF